jgi:alkylation response protein AidB-like acyl-CoA dehydrogenase
MGTDAGQIVAEAAERIFRDLAEPQTINQAGDQGWKEPLWQALAEAGLTLAWVPERFGGSGAGIADGFEILRVSGRYASPVPLAETLLAGWLLSQAGLACPAGRMTVAPARPQDRITLHADGSLSGTAIGVPFASEAEHIAVLAEDETGTAVALLKTEDCRLSNGASLAGDALDTVNFERSKPQQIVRVQDGVDRSALMLMGAAVRSVQAAGALEAVLEMSLRYANERIAFERPIGKFQAVQQNLARLAGEVAAALAAAGSAADTVAHSKKFDDALFVEVAAAKVRSAEAAAEGAAIAHQVHGAIGFTQEHILHRFTLRLLSWRDDFGDECHWAVALGNMVARHGADSFWPLIASR